ncbi:hypothetical protein HN51_047297, partial [Arachis hypogaea]
APLTEELLFRACMIPMLLCGGFKPYGVILLCPIFFSLGKFSDVSSTKMDLDISASVVISSRKQVLFPFSSSLPPINYIHYSISLFLQQNVEEAAEKLRAKGIEVLTLVCHVSNNQQRKDLIQKTAQCGNIDVIVSNAAANPSVDPILQTKDSVLDKLHLPCK